MTDKIQFSTSKLELVQMTVDKLDLTEYGQAYKDGYNWGAKDQLSLDQQVLDTVVAEKDRKIATKNFEIESLKRWLADERKRSVEFYSKAVSQAKQEVAKEIFENLEEQFGELPHIDSPGDEQLYFNLKAKYKG